MSRKRSRGSTASRSRKAPRSGVNHVVRHDRPDVAARIAWTYLACLIALVVAAIVGVVANSFLAGFGCRLDDPDAALSCRLGWDILVVAASFLLAFGLAARALKLDSWAWLALVAGMMGVLALSMGDTMPLGTWVSTASFVLMPAVAAVISAPWWPKPPGRSVHHALLIALAVLGVVAAVVSFAIG